jgi:hypothetical protein
MTRLALIGLLWALASSHAFAAPPCRGYACGKLQFFEDGKCLGVRVTSWSPVKIKLRLADTMIELTSADQGAVEARFLRYHPAEIEQCAALERSLARFVFAVTSYCSRLMSLAEPGPTPSQKIDPIAHGSSCVGSAEVIDVIAEVPPLDLAPCVGDACFTLQRVGACSVKNGGQEPASITLYDHDFRASVGASRVPPGASASMTDRWDNCKMPAVLIEARFQ